MGALLEFITSLAWPTVALVLGLKLRKPIGDAIKRMHLFKKGEIEIEFAVPSLESSKEANAEQKALPEPTRAEADLVAHVPDGAVIAAWAWLEVEMRSAASQIGKIEANAASSIVIDRLFDWGAIDQDTADVAHKLRVGRKQVAQDHVVPSEELAARYAETARLLVQRIHDGADSVELKRVLDRLDVTAATHVRIGSFLSLITDGIPEVARTGNLDSIRLGEWGAASATTVAPVKHRVALILVNAGATWIDGPDFEEPPYDLGIERDTTPPGQSRADERS